MKYNSLLLTQFFPPDKGGIQNYLYNICKNLPSDNIFVQSPIFSNEKRRNISEFDQLQAFKIFRYNPQNIFSKYHLTSFHTYKEVSTIIKKYATDSLLLGHFYIPHAISALIFKKTKNIPYTIFTHGLEILETNNCKKSEYILKLCLKNAQNIVVTTDYLKNEIIKKYSDLNLINKIIKLPPGVDYTFFRPGLDISEIRKKLNLEDKKIIFTCGRLIKRKNHQLIIKSLPEILKNVPNAIYLIGGTGPEKENLEKLVNTLSLKKYVKFLGEINNEDLPLFYNLSDVFCMPSLYDKEAGDVEGFGIVFIEAQACETPTIGSNTGGISDAIRDNKDGYLVNPESNQELASKITKLLMNNDLVQKFGKAGREKVIKEHSWSKLVERLL